jgi:uncharacterized protein YdeI (YjbR/CyaY-like superfamily)
MKLTFFRTPTDFRAWLDHHHASEKELWVGFYKVKSGKGGMVYRQALDEALCYGWIDGLLRSVDEDSYAQRFTPRKRDSTWSTANTQRVKELIVEGRMHPAGQAAFERRDRTKTGRYSFEQDAVALAPAFARRLKADRSAGAYFEAQPPGYRRVAVSWVMSAKKEETRARRFATLLEDCAAGRRLKVATPGRKD